MDGLNEPIPTITTDYEAFEFVARKLLEQNEKSMNGAEDCVYRGFRGSEIDEALSYAKVVVDDNLGEIEYLDSDDDEYSQRFDEYLYNLGFSLKCAAGWLIDDNKYASDLEARMADDSSVAETIINSNPAWLNGFDDGSAFELLRVLQFIHDRRDTSDWAKKFEMLKPYFDENRTSPSTMSCISVIPWRTIKVRSNPIPKAKPV